MVTDFVHKYRADPFLHTEINIIGLEIAYAAFILILTIGSIFVLYNEIVSGVLSALATALTSTTTPITAESITAPLEAVRRREIFQISVFIFGAAIAFGYFISRRALLPARNALAAQKQFIGNVAHELRTPLSIIKANTEIRLLDSTVQGSARTILVENLEELDRISDIINNLLSLNTLVQPERLPFSNVDMSEAARRVIERLEPLARKKPIKIRLRAARMHTAWGNPAALEQILMNLLKNAIQFTSKGEIVMYIGPNTHGYLDVVVRDSGTGIPGEDLQRIFEPFYRSDRSRTRIPGAGSGLGLAIVSELVKLHHGRITIRSTPGEGTSVTITLPPARNSAVVTEQTGLHPKEIALDFMNF